MIHNADLLAQFRAEHHSQTTELNLALLIAQALDKDVDVAAVESDLDTYVQDLNHQGVKTPHGLTVWFAQQGYGLSQARPGSVMFSNIRWVMQNRRGLPITLAVILIEVARRLGMSSQGINYPGHFMVKVADELIDPLVMKMVDPIQIVGQADDAASSGLLALATPQMLGMRMLNNVKAHYLQLREYANALNAIDYQLALAETDAALVGGLQYERGEIWQQLGAYAAAKQAYIDCVGVTPSQPLADKAREQIAMLDRLPAESSETRH